MQEKSRTYKNSPKRVYLRTFGCQMNEYDSELIKSILTNAGYIFIDNEQEADIILLNTCAVRESAVRKIYGQVNSIRYALKDKSVIIGILGCLPVNLGNELFKIKHFNIDFICGSDSYRRLPELIANSSTNSLKKEKPQDINLSDSELYSGIEPLRESGVDAKIVIMRGCNNFCSFCVVPYTRGRERSRSPYEIIKEITNATKQGYKQVTLLGQNVNSYYYEGIDFSRLMELIAKIDGVERIRFTSPHPKDLSERLLEVMASNHKICKHLHLPLQSGNDRILSLMNRSYTRKQYIDLVHKARYYCPDIALTTDIIVGFPTETDEEFYDTYTLICEVEFDAAFIFKYSQRKGTDAARLYPDDVSDEKKTERIVKLNSKQKEISLQKNINYIGKTVEVLIEQEYTSRSENDMQGRTDTNKIVIFPAGNWKQGDFVKVKITDASPHTLKGKIDNRNYEK